MVPLPYTERQETTQSWDLRMFCAATDVPNSPRAAWNVYHKPCLVVQVHTGSRASGPPDQSMMQPESLVVDVRLMLESLPAPLEVVDLYQILRESQSRLPGLAISPSSCVLSNRRSAPARAKILRNVVSLCYSRQDNQQRRTELHFASPKDANAFLMSIQYACKVTHIDSRHWEGCGTQAASKRTKHSSGRPKKAVSSPLHSSSQPLPRPYTSHQRSFPRSQGSDLSEFELSQPECHRSRPERLQPLPSSQPVHGMLRHQCTASSQTDKARQQQCDGRTTSDVWNARCASLQPESFSQSLTSPLPPLTQSLHTRASQLQPSSISGQVGPNNQSSYSETFDGTAPTRHPSFEKRRLVSMRVSESSSRLNNLRSSQPPPSARVPNNQSNQQWLTPSSLQTLDSLSSEMGSRVDESRSDDNTPPAHEALEDIPFSSQTRCAVEIQRSIMPASEHQRRAMATTDGRVSRVPSPLETPRQIPRNVLLGRTSLVSVAGDIACPGDLENKVSSLNSSWTKKRPTFVTPRKRQAPEGTAPTLSRTSGDVAVITAEKASREQNDPVSTQLQGAACEILRTLENGGAEAHVSTSQELTASVTSSQSPKLRNSIGRPGHADVFSPAETSAHARTKQIESDLAQCVEYLYEGRPVLEQEHNLEGPQEDSDVTVPPDSQDDLSVIKSTSEKSTTALTGIASTSQDNLAQRPEDQMMRRRLPEALVPFTTRAFKALVAASGARNDAALVTPTATVNSVNAGIAPDVNSDTAALPTQHPVTAVSTGEATAAPSAHTTSSLKVQAKPALATRPSSSGANVQSAISLVPAQKSAAQANSDQAEISLCAPDQVVSHLGDGSGLVTCLAENRSQRSLCVNQQGAQTSQVSAALPATADANGFCRERLDDATVLRTLILSLGMNFDVDPWIYIRDLCVQAGLGSLDTVLLQPVLRERNIHSTTSVEDQASSAEQQSGMTRDTARSILWAYYFLVCLQSAIKGNWTPFLDMGCGCREQIPWILLDILGPDCEYLVDRFASCLSRAISAAHCV